MTDIKKCSDSGDLIIVINRRLFMNSVKKSFLAGLIIIITGMIFVFNAKPACMDFSCNFGKTESAMDRFIAAQNQIGSEV